MVIRWLRSIFVSARKLIGTDYLGNKYYESIKGSGKVLRTIDAGVKHEDYESGQIPHEWEAWVRGKREQPPTEEEIEKRLRYTQTIQQRAYIKQIQDDENQARAYAEGLIAKEGPAKDIKQGTSIEKKDNDQIPTDESRAEPEAWKPPS